MILCASFCPGAIGTPSGYAVGAGHAREINGRTDVLSLIAGMACSYSLRSL